LHRVVAWSLSLLAGLAPLAVAARFWPRLTKAGAVVGAAAAILVWWALWHRSGYGENREYRFPESGSVLADTLFLPSLPPVFAIVLCSIAGLAAVSLLTGPPRERNVKRAPNKKPADDWDKPTRTGSGTE
jgi:Na+/proline symporter